MNLIDKLKGMRRVTGIINSNMTDREFATMRFHNVDMSVILTSIEENHKIVSYHTVVTIYKVIPHKTIEVVTLVNPSIEEIETEVLK